jgi:hypothetical protein
MVRLIISRNDVIVVYKSSLSVKVEIQRGVEEARMIHKFPESVLRASEGAVHCPPGRVEAKGAVQENRWYGSFWSREAENG